MTFTKLMLALVWLMSGTQVAPEAKVTPVLSKDLMAVPVEEIGGIESVLTIVDGRIAYAAGPFASMR